MVSFRPSKFSVKVKVRISHSPLLCGSPLAMFFWLCCLHLASEQWCSNLSFWSTRSGSKWTFGICIGTIYLLLFWGKLESQKQWIGHHTNRTQTHEGSSNWWSQHGPSYWQQHSSSNWNSNLYISTNGIRQTFLQEQAKQIPYLSKQFANKWYRRVRNKC